MIILGKCCRLLHDGHGIKSSSYSKCAKPFPLSLMTRWPFLCIKACPLRKINASRKSLVPPHKFHYFQTTMHSANASTVSNNELYFNASCHFRNRRWDLFLKWQTSPLTMELCERAAGGRLVSCDCCALSNSAVFEFLCSSETVSF